MNSEIGRLGKEGVQYPLSGDYSRVERSIAGLLWENYGYPLHSLMLIDRLNNFIPAVRQMNEDDRRSYRRYVLDTGIGQGQLLLRGKIRSTTHSKYLFPAKGDDPIELENAYQNLWVINNRLRSKLEKAASRHQLYTLVGTGCFTMTKRLPADYSQPVTIMGFRQTPDSVVKEKKESDLKRGIYEAYKYARLLQPKEENGKIFKLEPELNPLAFSLFQLLIWNSPDGNDHYTSEILELLSLVAFVEGPAKFEVEHFFEKAKADLKRFFNRNSIPLSLKDNGLFIELKEKMVAGP